MWHVWGTGEADKGFWWGDMMVRDPWNTQA